MSQAPICPHCNKPAELVTGDKIYGPRFAHIHLWICHPCVAWVGCHKGTKKPLGLPAKQGTRTAREDAHEHFDKLWRGPSKIWERSEAYHELALHLGIRFDDCHIGNFDIDTCKKTVAFAKSKIPCVES